MSGRERDASSAFSVLQVPSPLCSCAPFVHSHTLIQGRDLGTIIHISEASFPAGVAVEPCAGHTSTGRCDPIINTQLGCFCKISIDSTLIFKKCIYFCFVCAGVCLLICGCTVRSVPDVRRGQLIAGTVLKRGC